MNRLINDMPSTFSGVIAATVIAGTMSLITTPLQDESLFIHHVTLPKYSIHGTLDTYSNPNAVIMNPQIATERELKNLVDKILESQVALDVEFDNIITANARKLYQHGFSV